MTKNKLVYTFTDEKSICECTISVVVQYIFQWKEEAAEEVQAAVATAQQEPGPDPYEEDWKVYASPDLNPAD